MRVFNPNFTPVGGPLSAIQAAIDAWFAGNSGVEAVTFDQMRTYFANNGYPGAVNWTDGQIHAQLFEWGYRVEVE